MAGFLALPLGFRQSLLVHQPTLPRGLHRLWCESNFRGLVVPGSKGAALEVASSKAIFLGIFGFAPPPSGGNLLVELFPPSREVPPLDDRTLNEIANYFQPRLQQYRLDHAKQVRESVFAAPGLRFPISELARKLGACIQGDANLALQIGPLLSGLDDTIDGCNLDCAIIETLWPRLHSDLAKTKMITIKVEAELTADANTYLLGCGEIRQYSSEEVGFRVGSLGLTKKRSKAGSLLLLDRKN
jgi:hypothetical protein